VPIRYVKEDSSDNTVRTSSCNLNFNYVSVYPADDAYELAIDELNSLIELRLDNKTIDNGYYEFDLNYLSESRRDVPFAVVYETAHFGSDIGIVSGSDNRNSLLPLINAALKTPYDDAAYQQTAEVFNAANNETFIKAKDLDSNIFEWNKQSQYEGHAQLIFRLVDQFENAVEHFDVTFKTVEISEGRPRLEKMIEDRHCNKKDKGTITFYLRTQSFDKKNKQWIDLLDNVSDLDIEITGYEPLSGDIAYLPVKIHLTSALIQRLIQSFRTTIVDVELVRLPSEKVFTIESV
jgi:hypothetical protein